MFFAHNFCEILQSLYYYDYSISVAIDIILYFAVISHPGIFRYIIPCIYLQRMYTLFSRWPLFSLEFYRDPTAFRIKLNVPKPFFFLSKVTFYVMSVIVCGDSSRTLHNISCWNLERGKSPHRPSEKSN